MTAVTVQISDPRVATAVRTCDRSPTQYEGQLADGRFWYLRYRWGGLSVGVGADVDEAIGHDGASRVLDPEGWDGYLSHAEVDKLMPALLDELGVTL